MTLHEFWHGHKKKLGIVGYDGICNVWGCEWCELRTEKEAIKQSSRREWK